jgi:hypothetical protein
VPVVVDEHGDLRGAGHEQSPAGQRKAEARINRLFGLEPTNH